MPLTVRMDPAVAPPPSGLDEEVARAIPPALGSSPGKKQARARKCPTCEQAFSGEARFCPFDGDALVAAPEWDPAADPLLGEVVDGRYEVVSVIGEGGMGTVYEVRHAALGRRLALKVLRRDIADAEHAARFIQEAKAAAAIGHPNIVAVSDFGELVIPDLASRASSPGGSRVPYFVMEYLAGISLAALLKSEKTLDPLRAADIVLQCAAGHSAAHAAGVIHRDLKPDNVFLTRSGDHEFVKLLDFGVAKMAGAGRLTRAGMVFGTPHYMSPEQAAGQSVDHRADIYALGVILYECLAGKVPFEADTYMGVLTKHMFATPEPIDRAMPDASQLGALGPIVMRCLAKSPHDRYPSMAELVAAIELALADAGVPRPGLRSERPRARSQPSPFSSLRPPGLRPVMSPVGYGLAALAILVVLGLGLYELRPSHAETPAQATAVPAPTGAPSVAATATAAATSAPAPSPPVGPSPPGGTAAPAATLTPAASTSEPGGTPTASSPRFPGGKAGGRKEGRSSGGGDVVTPKGWN